jgi:hypothetical protein
MEFYHTAYHCAAIAPNHFIEASFVSLSLLATSVIILGRSLGCETHFERALVDFIKFQFHLAGSRARPHFCGVTRENPCKGKQTDSNHGLTFLGNPEWQVEADGAQDVKDSWRGYGHIVLNPLWSACHVR